MGVNAAEITDRLLRFIGPDAGNDENKGCTYVDITERVKRLKSGERGGFAQALALAWDRADTENATAIECAFPRLFLR